MTVRSWFADPNFNRLIQPFEAVSMGLLCPTCALSSAGTAKVSPFEGPTSAGKRRGGLRRLPLEADAEVTVHRLLVVAEVRRGPLEDDAALVEEEGAVG